MKEFEGELKSINPERLIGEGKDATEDFFLTLSLIFNDLKGLVLLDKLVRETYRFPNQTEVSAHAGEFSGVRLQIYRLTVGLVREFLGFLEANKSVLKTLEFQLLKKGIPVGPRQQWEEIEAVALNKDLLPGTSEFFDTLYRIRDKIAFHYQSEKILRGSFKKFFKEKKIEQSRVAYYSIGHTMSSTRFYYADAAAQEYISSKLAGIETNQFAEHQERLYEFIDRMNIAVFHLLDQYLKRRPHR